MTTRRFLALVTAGVLVASCAGPPAAPTASSSPAQSSPPRGGTLRVVKPASLLPELRDPSAELLDPQGNVGSWISTALQRCCLSRTLLSHNGRPAEEGGARLQPDIAAALPEVSADGLTWTFRLKEGLHYGPPLQEVEITARDFVRSFHRLFSPAIASDWSWVFTVIEGATEYQNGEAASISGLEAPDDHTFVIRLTEPTGDFGARLALPAAGPLPPDPDHPAAAFGIAEGADANYGQFVVSSGPYMLEGSEALDFSVPAAQRAPARGLAPGRMTLVRNPSWDAASDGLRPAYADRIELYLADSVEEAVAELDAGRADLLWPGPNDVSADLFGSFQGDPARGHAYLNSMMGMRGLFMNVAVPPFDDLHVRKALNYAIDKQHLVELLGGPVVSEAFGHVFPDATVDGLLRAYDPYATPDSRGDVEKARAEMARSRYDTNGDGRCDAAVCQHVRAVTREPFSEVATAVAGDLQPLGIDLEVEVLDFDSFNEAGYMHPEAKIPLFVGQGVAPLDISPADMLLLYDGRLSVDVPPDTYNITMVGATPEQLRKWGYEVVDVRNLDDRVEACLATVGAAQFECAASIDQYLMENVVPLVPFAQLRQAVLAGPRVLSYGFDELSKQPALDQIAVKP